MGSLRPPFPKAINDPPRVGSFFLQLRKKQEGLKILNNNKQYYIEFILRI